MSADTRWTYQVIEIKPALFGPSVTERAQEELNNAGRLGWELVSVVQSTAGVPMHLFLKKEI
jgi:hypothetical protein